MEKFRKLGLSEEFIDLIKKAKFIEPSEIQEKAIPLCMQGKDIIGGSATGSGKTLAFGASIIEKTIKGKGIQVLILTPTRELAEQVGNVLKSFSSFKNLGVSIIYGGISISPQISSLESSEIIVATPGRMLDIMQRGEVDLKKINTLVLDEADRMLDMGFIEDVERIISAVPKKRQTMLFSATISPDIAYLSAKYMINPVDVAVEDHVDPTKLKQVYYDLEREQKFPLLVNLLQKEKSGLVMVFCNTRETVDFIAKQLRIKKIHSLAIHGGLSQNKRNDILSSFHSGEVYVLVCTDVAARGLDIKNVSHVYNYDIPKNSKEYIHRIGRTARAGKEGIAVSLVSQRDYDNFRNVLIDDSIKIEKLEVPLDLPVVRFVHSFRRTDTRNNQRSGSNHYRARRY